MSVTLDPTRPRLTSRFDADSTGAEVMQGVDLSGRTAIVTGAASGLGAETARVLALAGAQVTLAARNLEAARKVATDIDAQAGPGRTNVAELELGDLASVRRFAEAWGERPLHLLINNAGVMACPFGRTLDGFETQFGVNHLGHFLLTQLLLPALRRGAPGRVVALSSSGHLYSDIHFEDPHYRTRPYKAFEAYGQSKTANALFALEFDRRHGGEGLHAFSLMPGVIATPLLRHMNAEVYAEIGVKPKPAADGGSAVPSSVAKPKSVEQGVATTLWAATAPELEAHGGLYLEDCAEAEPHAPGARRGVAAYARDPERARRLWELSEREVGPGR